MCPAVFLTSVGSGAENGLLSLRLSSSQSASLGKFLLAPVCPIETVTPWVGFLYLMSGLEKDEGVAKDKLGMRTRDPRSKTQYAIH